MEFVLRREKKTIQPIEQDGQGAHIYLLYKGSGVVEAFDTTLDLIPNDVILFPTSIPYCFSLGEQSEALYCYCSNSLMKRINRIPMMKTNFYYWTSNAGIRHQNYLSLSKEMAEEILEFSDCFEKETTEKKFFIMVRFLTMICTLLQKSSLYNLSEVKSVLTQQVLHFIDNHLDEKLSLERIAEAHYVSVSKLQRTFQPDVRLSVNTYILYRRLEEAKRSIIYGKNITKAWDDSGFTDYSNFSKAFKTVFGISPRAYSEREVRRKEEEL
ncbi:MAG: AraC family transcriptional regulator [Clostridia bacterium]|nr:AraC family transcriptional regulator [Clostridia bacterium]